MADLRMNYISLKPGTKYQIEVSGEKIGAADNLQQSLAPKQRSCKFYSETEDSTVFQKYTSQNCLFECKMKRAFEFCGCVPWNYPPFDARDGLTPVCDSFGNECFDNFMTDNKHSKLDFCNCLPNCQEFLYSYLINEQPISLTEYCYLGTYQQLTEKYQV